MLVSPGNNSEEFPENLAGKEPPQVKAVGWSYSVIEALSLLRPIEERLKTVPGAAELLVECETAKCTDWL